MRYAKDIIIGALAAYVAWDLYLMYMYKQHYPSKYGEMYQTMKKKYMKQALIVGVVVGLSVGWASYYTMDGKALA